MRGEEVTYMECLKIKSQELETQFQKDEAHWRQSLTKAKEAQEAAQKHIRDALEHFKKNLASIMIGESVQAQRFRQTVKKLPFWGDDL